MAGGGALAEASAPFALRPTAESDVPWIVEACSDPVIQRWTRVPTPYGIDDARVFVASGGGSLLVRAVVDAVTDEGLGMVAVHNVHEATGDAALGYWVAPWARRRGVATWATLAIAAEAVALFGVHQASLDIAEANPASQGVARRAGFTPGPTPDGLCVPDGEGDSTAVRWVRTVG